MCVWEWGNWGLCAMCKCVCVCLFFSKKLCFFDVLLKPSPECVCVCVCKIKATVLCLAQQQPVIKSNAIKRLLVCLFAVFSDDAICVCLNRLKA